MKPEAVALRSKYCVPAVVYKVSKDPGAPYLNQTPTEKSWLTPIENEAAFVHNGVS